jgi:muconate cycloisomerase
MRIVELTAYHLRIPLKRAIRHASQRRTETDNLLVRCVLANGVTGYGEGVPRDYVTGETIDSTVALLKRTDWLAQLVPCADFTAAVQLAERLSLPPLPGDARACQGNAARCAVELAVLDAFGRHYGTPLSQVTRLLAPDLYAPVARVRYSGAIMSAQGFKLGLLSLLYRLYGFAALKVKVGIAGQDDAKRLRTIRKRVGKKVALRVDANEAFTLDQLRHSAAAWADFDLRSIEQPVPHERVAELAGMRAQLGIPIMLDESLCSLVDAHRAIEHKTCDLFNLRLSKCGGFIPSLHLAQLARQHGLGYQLGCQVGETAVLSAAGRHFASSVRDLWALEGSFDRHLVRNALGTTDLTFRWGGWAPALTRGGLGIDLAPHLLERATVRKEVLVG